MLIDTGPAGLAVARSLDARLAPFDRRLDGLMLTGGGEEALGGLTDLANRYRIGLAWAPVEAQAASEWLEARPVLSAAGTQLSADVGLGRIALAEGADLALEAAGPRLAWRQCRVQWITAEPNARRLAPAHALIVTANLDPLVLADVLVAANPRVVVLLSLPVLPPPELETALSERTVLALDLRGDVTFILDGERLWVETDREAPHECRSTAAPRDAPGQHSLGQRTGCDRIDGDSSIRSHPVHWPGSPGGVTGLRSLGRFARARRVTARAGTRN